MHGGQPGDRRATCGLNTQDSGKPFYMIFNTARAVRMAMKDRCEIERPVFHDSFATS